MFYWCYNYIQYFYSLLKTSIKYFYKVYNNYYKENNQCQYKFNCACYFSITLRVAFLKTEIFKKGGRDPVRKCIE